MYSFLLFRSDKIRATTQEKTQKLKFKLVGVFIFIQVLLIALIIFNYFWPEVLDPYIPLSF
jgi:hypothetical protein